MLKNETTQTKQEADMGSKADYFVESAAWVAGHGDALVREGCDALAGQFLVFIRSSEGTWRRTKNAPFADLDAAVASASKIPSRVEQGRLFAGYLRGLMTSDTHPDLVAAVNRLADFEERS